MNRHQHEVQDIFQESVTSEAGSTPAAAAHRLAQYGPDRLAEEDRISKVKIILRQFANPLAYSLLIAYWLFPHPLTAVFNR
jgi:magnesium-transporting ATPase (P-type)